MADLIAALREELAELERTRTLKRELPLGGPQGAVVEIDGHPGPVVMLTSNNYLGLANDPRIVQAAADGSL